MSESSWKYLSHFDLESFVVALMLAYPRVLWWSVIGAGEGVLYTGEQSPESHGLSFRLHLCHLLLR